MRSAVFVFAVLFSTVFCIMHEDTAEKSNSTPSNIAMPITLSKRGGKGHGRKSQRKHSSHGKKGGDGKSSGNSESKGENDVFSSIYKSLKGVPGLLNPALSQIKLPASSK